MRYLKRFKMFESNNMSLTDEQFEKIKSTFDRNAIQDSSSPLSYSWKEQKVIRKNPKDGSLEEINMTWSELLNKYYNDPDKKEEIDKLISSESVWSTSLFIEIICKNEKWKKHIRVKWEDTPEGKAWLKKQEENKKISTQPVIPSEPRTHLRISGKEVLTGEWKNDKFYPKLNKREIRFDKRYQSHNLDRNRYNKPEGFWYGFGDDWFKFRARKWDVSEENNYFEVVLKPDSFITISQPANNQKILQLVTAGDIEKFMEDFKIYGKILPEDFWTEFEKKYAGIEILNIELEYQDFPWLEVWEYNSGCIWNNDVIDYFKKRNKPFIEVSNIYFGTIGAGIVPFCKKTKKFLVGLRSNRVLEPNTWGGFGGKLDVNNEVQEEIEKAAIRELEEETGYSGEIKLQKGFVFKDDNFEYHNFIGIVEEEFDVKLNWENTSYKWLTYNELKTLQRKHFGLARFLSESESLFEKVLLADELKESIKWKKFYK